MVPVKEGFLKLNRELIFIIHQMLGIERDVLRRVNRELFELLKRWIFKGLVVRDLSLFGTLTEMSFAFRDEEAKNQYIMSLLPMNCGTIELLPYNRDPALLVRDIVRNLLKGSEENRDMSIVKDGEGNKKDVLSAENRRENEDIFFALRDLAWLIRPFFAEETLMFKVLKECVPWRIIVRIFFDVALRERKEPKGSEWKVIYNCFNHAMEESHPRAFENLSRLLASPKFPLPAIASNLEMMDSETRQIVFECFQRLHPCLALVNSLEGHPLEDLAEPDDWSLPFQHKCLGKDNLLAEQAQLLKLSAPKVVESVLKYDSGSRVLFDMELLAAFLHHYDPTGASYNQINQHFTDNMVTE